METATLTPDGLKVIMDHISKTEKRLLKIEKEIGGIKTQMKENLETILEAIDKSK